MDGLKKEEDGYSTATMSVIIWCSSCKIYKQITCFKKEQELLILEETNHKQCIRQGLYIKWNI